MKKKLRTIFKALPLKILSAWLFLGLSGAYAQTRQLTGTVTSAADGTTLPGVSITIKGTGKGAITDNNGKYRLSVDGNVTLVFSFIGYSSTEITTGTNNTYNIKLVPSSRDLAEVAVVAVGYGTTRKKDLTGSVSSVSAEQLEKVPVTTVDQALQGRAAGVQVINNDGAPGGGVNVQIRGVGSFGNNDPLYVVDGYPITGGLNNINTNDIASIDILKDASAAAIYGNRASNGVVIITTKRGSKNGVQVNLDGYEALQSKPKMYSVLTGAQWGALANKIATQDGYLPLPEWANASALRNADWQNFVYRHGLKQNYEFAIRGGNDKVQTAFTANYYNEKGIVLGAFYKRMNASANIDYTPMNWLRSSTSIKYTRGQNSVPFGTGGAGAGQGIGYLSKLPPTITGNKFTDQIYDGNGNYGFYNPINPMVKNWGNPVYNILVPDQAGYNNTVLTTSSLEVTVISGLKIKSNLGINAADYSGYYFTPVDNRATQQYGTSVSSGKNYYSQNSGNGYEWLWENTVSYDKTFGRHAVSFVAGLSYQRHTDHNDGAGGNDLPNDGLRDISFIPIASLTSYYGNETSYSYSSQFARLNYKFDDKYIITGTVRRDGSSRFGPGNQYGVFPSGSAAWRIKQEPFLKHVDAIWDLKLRGGYGQVGSQNNAGTFRYLTQYTTGGAATSSNNVGYPFNKIYQLGYAPAFLPNPDLQWETSKQTDIGIDAAFLKGDLSVTLDYYNKQSAKFLLDIPIPGQSGFGDAFRNVGSMSNKGYEIFINYHHSIGDFKYSLGFNLATVSNKLLSITSGANYVNNLGSLGFSSTGANNWTNYSRTYIGGPVGEFYGYVNNGIFQTQEEIDQLNATAAAKNGTGVQYQPFAVPGDRKFADLNGDGKITDADQKSLGSPIPKFYGGLNIDLQYKSWDLNAFFYGVSGNKIFNYQASTLQSFEQTTGGVGAQNISTAYLQNAWTPSNPSNIYPRITTNDQDGNQRPSSQWVENGSYLRLKNLQVGYTLPADLTRKLSISKVRIYLSTQNLFTITGYSGLDPEIGIPSDSNGQRLPTASGVDIGTYPSSKYYTVGLNVTF